MREFGCLPPDAMYVMVQLMVCSAMNCAMQAGKCPCGWPCPGLNHQSLHQADNLANALQGKPSCPGFQFACSPRYLSAVAMKGSAGGQGLTV